MLEVLDAAHMAKLSRDQTGARDVEGESPALSGTSQILQTPLWCSAQVTVNPPLCRGALGWINEWKTFAGVKRARTGCALDIPLSTGRLSIWDN